MGKMTREAAIELLKNRKVYVNGKSAEIQKKLFELGFEWPMDGNKVIHEDWPFLYTSDTKRIKCGTDMVQFSKDKNTEISYDEILAIEVEPDCPFKPFDKVLVRNGDKFIWHIEFFERYIGDFEPYLCLTGSWRQCIRYEGNESLLGTTKNPKN